jgi:hypothetical protein
VSKTKEPNRSVSVNRMPRVRHYDVAVMILWTYMCLLELYYLYMLSRFINNVTRPPKVFKANSTEVCFDADSIRRFLVLCKLA